MPNPPPSSTEADRRNDPVTAGVIVPDRPEPSTATHPPETAQGFRDIMECFENPAPGRAFTIEHHCPEFTSVCPKTGQPDYGTIVFRYIPDQVCVELKSLKFYLQALRNEGIFYEAVPNRLLDDFVAVVRPRWVRIESRWTPRGGLNSNIVVEHPDPGVPTPSHPNPDASRSGANA